MARIADFRIADRSGGEVLLKTADLEDADALGRYVTHILSESTFQVSQLHELDVSSEAQAKRIKEYLGGDGKLLLLAYAGAELVGMLDFANHPRSRKRHVGSFGISVHKNWRRRGIGQIMIEKMIDWATAHPYIEKVTLAVFATNIPAIPLYERMGFLEEGRRPNEIKLGPGQYMEDILMYRFVK